MKNKKKKNKVEQIYDPKAYSNHHIVAESRWWIVTPNNMKRIQNRVHSAIHFLFWIKTPTEIIRTVAEEFDTSLVDPFKKELFDLLDKYWNGAM